MAGNNGSRRRRAARRRQPQPGDDDVQLIGDDIQLNNEEDEAGIQETEDHETKKKTKDYYRNRVQKVITWFNENSEASIGRYAEEGKVHEITAEDHNNR
jgi:hypothetical protein